MGVFDDPAFGIKTVTPNDSTDIDLTRGLYIGTAGRYSTSSTPLAASGQVYLELHNPTGGDIDPPSADFIFTRIKFTT